MQRPEPLHAVMVPVLTAAHLGFAAAAGRGEEEAHEGEKQAAPHQDRALRHGLVYILQREKGEGGESQRTEESPAAYAISARQASSKQIMPALK